MQVSGLAQLLDDMRGLPEQVQTRVMKGAMATACTVIRNEAIIRAPIYTGKTQEGHPPPGTLKRSIYQARLVSECTATVETWIVSARKGAGAAGAKGGSRDAYYASWVEYGHYTRGPSARTAQQRKDNDRGKAVSLGTYFILAQPFMRPAFDSRKEEAVRAAADYIAAKVPAVWAKQGF